MLEEEYERIFKEMKGLRAQLRKDEERARTPTKEDIASKAVKVGSGKKLRNCQVHTTENGDLYYRSPSKIRSYFNEEDREIVSTASVRALGLDVYDGALPAVHINDKTFDKSDAPSK